MLELSWFIPYLHVRDKPYNQAVSQTPTAVHGNYLNLPINCKIFKRNETYQFTFPEVRSTPLFIATYARLSACLSNPSRDEKEK